MTESTISRLAEEWHSAGLGDGDTVLLHSSLKRLLRKIARMGGEFSSELIIASFQRVLGTAGTLILPLFNFDFTKGITFDIRNSPSHMGSLTEAGRLWPGAVRTGHPVYSFAVIGKNAEAFRGLKNFSGYGNDSPFALLHRLGGKIGVLDLPDQNSMTFYHYVEECLDVPYRYHKRFTGKYIDENGLESIRTFGLFVRKTDDGVVTRVDPMGEVLWEKHLYSGCRPGQGCGLRIIVAGDIFNEVEGVIKQGRAQGLLYDVE